MRGRDVRKSFLDYFARLGHTVVKSSSLVPEKDPTLLFTNAGMVQFKNIFLGVEQPSYPRAASAQKCLRISGKHNDLESVGKDTYHHTFFEMLGNWSFGDYYKEEAIAWAWQLLTGEWGLPKDRLWATVFRNDDEAEELWLKISNVPGDRVLRFDEKDNFWEMGEAGPCGPCSEIHLDRGPGACDRQGDKTHRCGVNAGCARFIELWNLVFIQYNRDATGRLEELPSKHVDTGMGLERITAVLQNVESDYDVDLLRSVIHTTEELANRRYGDEAQEDVSFRVIADHARAVSFLIADGVLPSNEGRGYVLRRLLRRAARHGRLLGFREPFLCRLVAAVSEALGDAYEEIKTDASRIATVVESEETRFAETLDKGLFLLQETLSELRRKKQTTLPGEVAFRLYDTYGFPLDLTEDILRNEGMAVDHQGFVQHMEEQRSRAREAREPLGITAFSGELTTDTGAPIVETCFFGYDRLELESTVLAIHAAGRAVSEASESDRVEVITGETPFYGESGGQVGDQGIIETVRGDRMQVTDTQHLTAKITVHRGRVVKGNLRLGDEVHLRVDPQHRRRTTLNHSATHILHAALREELGSHVRQAGSLVAPDRLRFDFSHMGPVPPGKLELIENKVNERVRLNAQVYSEEMNYDDAMRAGALAFFGDKYGDRVRVVKIGDFSTELCGGTHTHQSGEIGLFKLHSEGGVSAGVRRVEAFTGEGAMDLIRKYERILADIGQLIRGNPEETVDKLAKLLERQKQLERQLEQLRSRLSTDRIPDLLRKQQKINGTNFIVEKVDEMDPKQLRETVDQLKGQMGSGFIFLASSGEKSVTLVSSATPDLTKQYHAGNIIKQVAPIVKGGGGGRPDFAQAGGKDPSKVDEALDRVREILSNPAAP